MAATDITTPALASHMSELREVTAAEDIMDSAVAMAEAAVAEEVVVMEAAAAAVVVAAKGSNSRPTRHD